MVEKPPYAAHAKPEAAMRMYLATAIAIDHNAQAAAVDNRLGGRDRRLQVKEAGVRARCPIGGIWMTDRFLQRIERGLWLQG